MAAKALGDKFTAVFVDHGFMREGEPEAIRETFEKFPINFVMANVQERFMEKLKGVADPEKKRKVIGEEFIRVFEEIAKKSNAEYLLQGTIYPDRIESGIRKNSDVIKSHHNVAGLPTNIKFKKIVSPSATSTKMRSAKSPKCSAYPKNWLIVSLFQGQA